MRTATRYLWLIGACLAVASAAWTGTVPARILIGTSEAPLSPAPVFDGVGVLAPPYIIQLLGASCVTSSDGETLIVSGANGNTGTIKTVDVNGIRMVPVDKLVALVGGEQRWDAAKRILTLLSHLESVEFDNDTLTIHCSLPARATAKIWDGKIIVDVFNTKLASEAREVYIGTSTVSKARLGQYNETTARVVLELNKPTGCKLETAEAASQILLRVGDGLVPAPPPLTTATAGAAYTVHAVTVEPVKDDSLDIVITTSGKAAAVGALSVSPPQVTIDLPRATLSDECVVSGTHPCCEPVLNRTASGARLTLKLSRPLVYATEIRDTQVTIRLRPPDKAGGTLADKVIVIDPGHGGKETGAQAGGTKEKNVNLQLAKDLAAALSRVGARVVLTRESDQYVTLSSRPDVAVRCGADFFISLHCNSNLAPDSASGIETYYHMEEPSPKLLAYAIHDGVCKYTGMRDRRARSDRKLYESGLAVLRGLSGTQIPGILLECGYLNNKADRAKLLDAGYRAKLVAGIIAGLKAYVEGAPIE